MQGFGVFGLLALAGLGVASSVAQATWSIILVDTRTREVGIASATCLTGFDLRAGSPVVVTGVGAAAAQSFVESTNMTRTYIRDRLLEGVDPAAIMSGLPSVDGNHQRRQYGVVDAAGRSEVFTGSFAGAWAGGVNGQFAYTYLDRSGTIAYAIQGNVLTGPSVVNAALEAAERTAGDLPARLMAAMEAARVQGGDGRCSCDPESPTACGAPPATFTTSAQIGYVIVARLGDVDQCGGVYPGSNVAQVAVGDVLGDGSEDVALASVSGFVWRYENSSARRIALPPFAAGAPTLAPIVSVGAGSPSGAIAAGQLLAGGNAETVFASNLTSGPISILPGGTGGTASLVGTATGVRDLLISDVDRDGRNDVIALTLSGALLVFRDAGGGSYVQAATVQLGQQPSDMTVFDVDADGDDDIAVALAPASQVVVVENRTAAGGSIDLFARPANLLAGPARNIVTGDFDRDNDDDLAVTLNNASNSFQILSNAAGVLTVRAQAAARIAPASVASGDVTGDGIDDLLIGGGGGLATHRGVAGSAAGVTFSAGSALRVGSALGGPTELEIFDADGDGDNDVLTRDGTARLTVLENRGAPAGQPFGTLGTWVTTTGCAEGDYFLALNVGNVPSGAPDVVPVLQGQFSAWRANLTNKVDAVQSVIVVPRLTTATGPADMLITLRDWRGEVVTTPVTLEVDGAVAGTFTLGGPEVVEPGTYRVRVTPGTTPGAGPLQVRVRAGTDRAVVLMPLPVVAVGSACDSIDFNRNGVFPEDEDVIDFFRVLAGETCASCSDIDFNNNAVFPEDQDVIDFFSSLAGDIC
jgi:hypothetical protein